jgi:hypothetical protein
VSPALTAVTRALTAPRLPATAATTKITALTARASTLKKTRLRTNPGTVDEDFAPRLARHP